MRPTGYGNGTGIATCAGWERESLGSIWNGNFKRGMGMGNDGVGTEWEREWKRESSSYILNGNEDGNKWDKRGMGAEIRKSGACYMGLMALARERYRSAHQCITTG